MCVFGVCLHLSLCPPAPIRWLAFSHPSATVMSMRLVMTLNAMHYLANGLVADAGVLVVRPVSQRAKAALLTSAVTSFFPPSSPDHWFSSRFDKGLTVWEYLTHSLCGSQLHTASKPCCANTDHFDKMKNKSHWPRLYIQEWKKKVLFGLFGCWHCVEPF